MTKIKDYLNSGIIEKYCLGLATSDEVANLELICKLYPEVQKKLDKNQELLEQYISIYQKQVPHHSKQQIIDRLENLKLKSTELNQQGRIDQFIRLSPLTDLQQWENFLCPIVPISTFDNIYIHPLFSNQRF